jgi:hypothetical protein
MLPGAPAIRFAHKLTKKQARFLQDAIMPDRIRIEAIWPSGLAKRFNARLYKNSRLVKNHARAQAGFPKAQTSSQAVLTQSYSYITILTSGESCSVGILPRARITRISINLILELLCDRGLVLLPFSSSVRKLYAMTICQEFVEKLCLC